MHELQKAVEAEHDKHQTEQGSGNDNQDFHFGFGTELSTSRAERSVIENRSGDPLLQFVHVVEHAARDADNEHF